MITAASSFKLQASSFKLQASSEERMAKDLLAAGSWPLAAAFKNVESL
ncbi:hypothetical protein [Phytopseudomonas daroniae]|nr:hypothetical protein [Pseudomonas daroniae]